MIKTVFLLLIPLITMAQIRVQFSDPNRPGTVRVEAPSGSINVTGTTGKDVVIETQRMRSDGKADGIEVREENNMIRIDGSGSKNRPLHIQVPVRTSIIARNVNNGTIMIENVDGEIEAQNVNGNIILTFVSGSVIANTVNGKIAMKMIRATAGKPMSFTTLNGSIDLTLPPDIKANLRMIADNGEINTGFEILVQRSQENDRRGNTDAITGKINGGGAEIRIHTVNGSIFVRK